MSARERQGQRLSAYLDGELRPGAARRLARRLARSPELAEELERLRAVGELVRESQAAAPPVPDPWPALAAALPAIDAERVRRGRAGRRWALPRLAWPRSLAAGLAAAGLAAVLAAGLLRPLLGGGPASDVVSWLDAGGRAVMVLQGEQDTTIIWVLDPAAGSDELSEEGRRGLA